MLRVVEEERSNGGVGAGAGTTGAAAHVGSGAGRTGATAGWTITTAKFLQPVRPGDALTLEHEALTNGAIRFAIRSAGRAVATGTLVPRPEVTEADNGHQAG
jgi:3-hydroxymyristoyl/3-hydroxydecanoyl-(acyl carrier protein) dehydratase